MAFFKASFLEALRQEILQRVCRFQYQLNGGSWYNGTVNSKEIAGNSVVVFVSIPSSGSVDTITRVRVFDQNDVLAGEQAVSLQRSAINTALLRFTFPLTEAE